MGDPYESWAARLTVALIGIAAICGNALVLWVFFRKRNTFKKTAFDIFIINLAVSDFLAGIFMFFSRFVSQPPIPENYTGAMMYCSLLWGGYILFSLGHVSVYICFAVAIERWLALIKPHFYQRVKAKHAMVTLIFVWIWAFLINISVFFSLKADFDKRTCNWVHPETGNVFAIFEITMQGIVPFSIIIMLYFHIYYRVRAMKNLKGTIQDCIKRRLTIIALVASLALIVGWLPAELSFMMLFTSVRGEHLSGVAHLIFIMLAMSNSFINPILYGICSSKFRDEYKELLIDLLCKLPKCTDKEEENTEQTLDI